MFGIVLVFRPHEIAERPATKKPISSDGRGFPGSGNAGGQSSVEEGSSSAGSLSKDELSTGHSGNWEQLSLQSAQTELQRGSCFSGLTQKPLFCAYLIPLLRFKLLLAAVNLAIMKQVLTLEVIGTGVEAAELAVALVSGLHCLFCIDKIRAILVHKNV